MYLRMKRGKTLNIETVIVECLETLAFAGYSRLKGLICVVCMCDKMPCSILSHIDFERRREVATSYATR